MTTRSIAGDLFHQGRLTEALGAALDAVRNDPTSEAKRWFLVEMSLFAGETERADKHLDWLCSAAASPNLAALRTRQWLRAETTRREVWEQGRVPGFVSDPPEHIKHLLTALVAKRTGDAAAVQAAMEAAEASRPVVGGVLSGVRFQGWRDLDEFNAGFFEVFAPNGDYNWIPVELVASLEFTPPSRALDLLYRTVSLTLRDGRDGTVVIPALYPFSHRAGSEELRLGRGTDYSAQAPIQGVGLREFLVGEDVFTVLQLSSVQFDGATA
jgi:type VI secretion system protein ImpE